MSEPTWRKSSHSMSNGDCVEVAQVPGGVVVRDSKDRGGVVLGFGAGVWAAFVREVREQR